MPDTNVTTTTSDDMDMLSGDMSSEEKLIIKELLSSSDSPDNLIPADISPTDLWTCLSAACKGSRKVAAAGTKIKLYLGAVLTRLQDHPDLWTAQGYKTFNDFMTRGVEELFGVSRAEAFLTKRIIEETGKILTIDQMSEIGISNLNIASGAIRKRVPSGATPEQREKVTNYWIEAAKKDSFQQIKERAASEGIVDSPQDFTMVARTLNIKESTDTRWMAFRKQPWVSAKGGGTDGSILDAMMDECASWEAEFEESQRGS